jgi:hypothetical protein
VKEEERWNVRKSVRRREKARRGKRNVERWRIAN